MQNILLITSQVELYYLASLFFNQGESTFRVLWARSVSESIDLIEEQTDFSLVYLGHIIHKDASLKDLSTKLIPIVNAGHCLIAGTNRALNGKEWASYFNEFETALNIFKGIFKLLNFSPPSNQSFEVPPLTLLEYEKYPVDFFQREGAKFKLIFPKGAEVDIDEIYEVQSPLFVLMEDAQSEMNNLNRQVSNNHNQEDPKFDVSLELATEHTISLLKKSGFPIKEQYVDLTKDSINETKEVVKNAKKSKEQLMALLNKKQKFYYKHISMTSLIGCYILDEMMLTDEELKKKICLASQFQNIFLHSESELKVFDDEQVGRFQLEEKKRVMNHPLMAFELLAQNREIDADVLKIVREQHGDKRGVGFPDNMQSSLKLCLIFQVATYFSQRFLIEHENGLQPQVTKIYDGIYGKLTVKDQSVMKALKKIMGELPSF